MTSPLFAEAASPSADSIRIGVDLRCLTTSQIRGFARYTLELTQALVRQPHVEVLGFTTHALAVPLDGVEIVTFGARREVIAEQYVLPALLNKHRVDVFVCPTNRGLPLGGPPSVLVLHDAVEWDAELVERSSSRKSRWRFSYSTLLSLAAASVIITVSEYSARELSRVLGIPRHRLKVIHEAPGCLDRGSVPAAEPGFGLPPQDSYVLYHGGFDKKKDLPTLLRGFAASVNARHLRLVLIGDPGRHREELDALCEVLAITDRVDVLGYVSDAVLTEALAGCSVFASASLGEGFGLPAAEAMAAGRPVIVAAAGASPEVVSYGGLLFPAGDVAALAALLDDLCDPATRDRWAARAAGRARDFAWDRTAGHVASTCRDVAASEGLRQRLGRLPQVAQGMVGRER